MSDSESIKGEVARLRAENQLLRDQLAYAAALVTGDAPWEPALYAHDAAEDRGRDLTAALQRAKESTETTLLHIENALRGDQ